MSHFDYPWTEGRILAWRIPWTEEPGGLQWGHKGPWGSQRVRHD